MRGRILHEDASSGTLAVARAWIFGMCLGDVVREPVLDLVGMPLEYVRAVGPLALLPEAARRVLYTAPTLVGFKWILAALLVLCVLRVRPSRPIAVATCALLTVFHALLASVGHVNHGELPMLYGAWVLALFPAAAPAAAMAFVTLVFCLTYTFTAGYRLAASAPAIFVDGSVMRLIIEPVLKPGILAAPRGAELLAAPHAPVVLSAGFVWVTFVELLSPLALFVPSFRWLWIASMVVFHAFAWGVMQIAFVHNLILMPLLMLDWERWVRARPARADVDWDHEWLVAWKPHRANAWFRHQADVLGAIVRRTASAGHVLKTDAFEEACRLPSLVDGARTVLMDVSPRILGGAAGAMACATDVRRLAFRRATFAAVVSHSTLDHFAGTDDIVVAFREIRRVLEPGGRLVVTLDNPENPVLAMRRALHEIAGRIGGLIPFAMGRTLSRAALVRALEREGFTVVESGYALHTPRVVALWLGEWTARAGMSRMGRALGTLLRWGERTLAALPTRRWSAHFVVADCRAAGPTDR